MHCGTSLAMASAPAAPNGKSAPGENSGRAFVSPADFNAQLGNWLTRANARVVRTMKARPVDLLEADRAGMLPLSPVAPAVGWVNRVRLGRDYYVRVDSSDYSVDPALIGRFSGQVAEGLRGVMPRLSRSRCLLWLTSEVAAAALRFLPGLAWPSVR
jgi:hypothetical protein